MIQMLTTPYGMFEIRLRVAFIRGNTLYRGLVVSVEGCGAGAPVQVLTDEPDMVIEVAPEHLIHESKLSEV
jgi:hypothetical protein